MRLVLATSALALCSSPLLAQVDHKIVFPIAFYHSEGNTHDNTLVNAPYQRWQQIDSDSLNNPHIVKFVRFRQDSFATTANAKNRTIDAQITMGAGLLQSFGNDFDANYLPFTKQVIMNRTTINLPDWSQLPSAPPRPFDMTFPMNFIWSHNGFTNLVWEIEVWGGSGSADYHVDADSASGTAVATSTALGTGCTTNTGVFTNNTSLTVTNFDANYSLGLGVTGAPIGSPITFMLGTSDPNLAIGMCSSLRVLPAITVPIGFANASGDVSVSIGATNYNPAWVGIQLFTQAVGPDASQPFLPLALSDGAQTAFPAHAHNIQHVVSTTPLAPTGTGPLQGGIIIEISDTN